MAGFAEKAAKLAEQAKEKAAELKEKAGPLAVQAKEKAVPLAAQAKEKADEFAEHASPHVQTAYKRSQALAAQAGGMIAQGVNTLANTLDKAKNGSTATTPDGATAPVATAEGAEADGPVETEADAPVDETGGESGEAPPAG